MAQGSQYYIAQGENVQGPFPLGQIERFVREGKARADMMYSVDGGEWVQGYDLPDLFPDAAPADLDVRDAAPRAERERLAPHRGGAVLALGIIGLVVCFVCGIFAWAMGAEDLKKMNRGLMDPSGKGMTQAGMVCGMISVALVGVALLVAVLTLIGGGLVVRRLS
jgi:hypothetical protein